MSPSTSQPSPPATCYHCLLPLADNQTNNQFSCELAGQQRFFCCPACRAVAQTIHAGGLGSFYQYQEAGERRPQDPLLQEAFVAFDDKSFQQRFVKESKDSPEASASIELLIGGIHCAACIWLLEKQLMQLEGMIKVSVSLTEQKATLHWRKEQLALSHICQAIAAIGYDPEPYHHDQLVELQQREQRTALRRLGIAGIGMMQAGMFAIALYAGDLQSINTEHRDFMRVISLLVATVVVFYSARSFFTGAWHGLKKLKAVMDLPVAIAIGLAYGASLRATLTGSGEVYFDSVTMFTFLLLAGRYLEMRARHYSGRISSNLQSLLPSTALLIEPGSEKTQHPIPLFNVKRGDLLLVKAGQTIPADGTIAEGFSCINEAQLTGEFAPQNKQKGDTVVAGTVNISNPITLKVEATGADLQLEAIGQLLNRAQQSKPRIAELADRLSLYFISIILLIAAATYFSWLQIDAPKAFWITLSVLVVSCPCALSLATPAALTAASNRLRQAGVFVAASQLWETVPSITHVVFDKTGTLTKGLLSVQKCHSFEQYTDAECLQVAAMLENNSEHPIAKAFSHYSLSTAKDVEITTHQGIEGSVNGKRYRIGTADFVTAGFSQETPKPKALDQAVNDELPLKPPRDQQGLTSGQWILLGDQQGPCAWFLLHDQLRDDTQSTVKKLQQQGLILHVLSGDSSGSAESLCQQLGIKYCVAGASPADKLAYLQTLQQQHKVMMLGDGINDIPVLAAADVSVAMSNAPDVTKTQADCVLLSGHLSAVLTLKQLSIRARQAIQQNLGWALLYNLCIIPLAVQGLIPPYLAAIGMSLSSLLVLLNSLRLHRWQETSLQISPNDPPTQLLAIEGKQY